MDLQNQDSFFSSSNNDAATSRLDPTTPNQLAETSKTPLDVNSPLPTDSFINPAQNSAAENKSRLARQVVPNSPLHDAIDRVRDEDDDAETLRRNSSSVDVAESFLLNAAADGHRRFDLQGGDAAGSRQGVEGDERSNVEGDNKQQQLFQLLNNSSNSPAVIAHSQSHDGILSSSPKDASAQLQQQQQHFRPHHARNASAGGDSLTGSKLPHKNLLTYTMEDQAILMKTRMRSLSLPYALKVKSPETIAKESGSVWRSIFLSPKGFLVVLCVAILAQSMLVSGYIPSIITTIQKRFQFSSKRTGMIIASYDVANLCMVPLVSYFGAKGRRPLWLCMGAMLIFIAAIGFTMPYFLSPNYQLTNSTGNPISDTLCHGGKGQTIADQAKFFELFYFHKGPSTSECNGGPSGQDSKGHNSWPSLTPQSWPFYVFLVSLCAFGIGSTPFYTLGTAYLHDNSPEEVVSVYVGILYAMGALGPAIGFLVGALFISFYEDPFNGPPKGVSEGDLAWVGAWWGGIIIGAILIFIFGITLFFFPKQILPKKGVKIANREGQEYDVDDDDDDVREDDRDGEEEKEKIENKEDESADDSACFSYDRTQSMESRGTSHRRPTSESTWASSCVTVDTGRGSGGASGSANANVSSGAGSCSSPEVFLSNGDSGAGCRPSSPPRHHLAVEQQQQRTQARDSIASPQPKPLSSPAGRGRDLASTPSSSPLDTNHPQPHSSSNAYDNNEDDLLPMPSLLDSNAPKTVLLIWAFVRSFFVDLFSILFNPVWLLLTMFTVGEVIVVDAFIVFGPKYIQTVFNVDASSANVLAGVVMVPSAVIGMILGGVLIRRFRLSLRGQLWFLVLCAVTSLSAVFGLMFVSCTNVQIAGFNIGYDTSEPDMNVTVNYLPTANLTSHCNLNCDCDDHWYEPVCGANQKTYFNPCYAGCRDLEVTSTPEGTTIWNYTQCSCVYSDIEYRHNGFDRSGANVGRCHQPCHSIYVFLLIFAIAVFAGCCAQSPVLVITLGTVDENMKSFALGLQYFLQRGMAYIPTPIYFGYIIDSTCLIWQWNCESGGEGGIAHDTRGLCLEYDRKRLPPTMFGSSLVVKTLGLVFLLTCAILNRKLPFRLPATAEESPDKRNAKKKNDKDSEKTPNTKITQSTPRHALTPDHRRVNDATPFAVDVTPISTEIDAGFSSTSKTKLTEKVADSSILSPESSVGKTVFKGDAVRKGRTSRRALFRHRKLEDVCSDEEDCVGGDGGDGSSSFPDSFVVTSPEKELKARHQKTQNDKSSRKETPSRRSAKKGGDSSSLVQYNRMRCESEVEIDLAGGPAITDFRI